MNQQAISHLDRLDHELQQLQEEFSQYTHEQLNHKPSDGGWSAMQCLHHLMLAEQASHRYVVKKLSFNPTLKNYNPAIEWGRRMLINNYLLSPFKIKAPSYLDGDNLHAESRLQSSIADWQQQRKELRDYLASLDDDLYRKSVMKHPFAGRISLGTMLSFFQAHFTHHKRQALRVLQGG